MAGFRPTQVVIGIAGELVKGFTTTMTQERKRPEAPIDDAELVKLIDSVQREALQEAERSITWETGLPHVDVRLVHSAIVGASIDGYGLTNPVGLPGPPRQDRRSSTRSRRSCTWAPSSRSRASSTSSCSRSSPSRTRSPGCWARSNVRQAGALFIDVGGGTTDVALVRQGGIEGTRMFALGGRAFTKSIADRLDLPFPRAESLKVDYARGLPVERARRGRGDRAATTSRSGPPASSWSWRSWPRARCCRRGSTSAAAGRGCPRSSEALAAERFWKRLPFARPPEVTIMAPDQVEAIDDATDLLVDQQDVTPLGPRVPGDRAPDLRGPARRDPAARAARDEGLTVASGRRASAVVAGRPRSEPG